MFHSRTLKAPTDAADHPLRGIFHPLGAAFFSNATYPETLKVLNQTNVSIESFALAGAREMFRYNYTNGLIDLNPAPAPQFFAAVSAEIPRYVQVWNERFRKISATNYKVRQMCKVARNRCADSGNRMVCPTSSPCPARNGSARTTSPLSPFYS